MPVVHREKPNWNPLTQVWGKNAHLGEPSGGQWLDSHTRAFSWTGLLGQWLLCWLGNLRAKLKLVCSENPGKRFRSWSQMYIVLFLKGYFERLVGSKSWLVAVLNVATICTAEEAMTLITRNLRRGNLVSCQVNFIGLWLAGRKDFKGLSRISQLRCKWEFEQLFI